MRLRSKVITSGPGVVTESTRRIERVTRSFTESNRRSLDDSVGGGGEKIPPQVTSKVNCKAIMPEVEVMRRTRVFGVVNRVDGARVLRSGRRLWPDCGDGKLKRGNDGDDWFRVIKKVHNNNKSRGNNNPVKGKEHGNLLKCKQSGWGSSAKLKQEVPDIDIEVPKRAKNEDLGDHEKKMFGMVYSRKRKRMDMEKQNALEDKMYGIQFSRRQRKKQQGSSNSLMGFEHSCVLAIVDDGSCNGRLAHLLSVILSYIRRVNLTLSKLATLLFSEPLSSSFASNGICFLLEPSVNRTGICKFFGDRKFVPLFSVDFSAIPLCFMYMHLSLFFRFKCLPLVPVNTSVDLDTCEEMLSESGDDCMETIDTKIGGPKTNFGNKLLHPSVRGSKLAGRNNQYRNGLNSRGIQKRRSSLRRRRARNLSVAGMHKANGALMSDIISNRKNGIPFSSVVTRSKLRSSMQSSSAEGLKQGSANKVGKRGKDLSICSANILVTEADRCHRIEGATVALEVSDTGEWMLVAKKDGSSRYIHLAQKIMRPCSTNRVTHDTIWTGEENWKLEFPNKQDWFIFKELYKECSDRNVPSPVSKAIPVPVVREVEYADVSSAPFSRPDAYISVSNDEVTRALTKRTAIYDMDCEDEEWLKKFNNEFCAENELLSEDNFELIIDTLEKAFYCSPEDLTDENAAINLCLDWGKKEVVEAVYGYWIKKRKQKRSVLLRIFQGHQAKRASLIPKPALRKRRSFKRQSSQFGRGKQPILLQAMTAEQNAEEEHIAMHRVEEAKNSARRSSDFAIAKRRRAQLLMDNADLAIYKATMARRIAMAARLSGSTDVAVTHFMD